MPNLVYQKSVDPYSAPPPHSPPSSISTPTIPARSEKQLDDHYHPPSSDRDRSQSTYLRMSAFPSPKGRQRSLSLDVPGEGDQKNTGPVRFWLSIARSNIIIRWFCFITPILAVVWIPGIIGLSMPHKNLQIAGVPLVWWSAWLSVAWLGWWIGLTVGSLLPHLFKHTIGIILSPDFTEKWFGFLLPMRKVIMGTVWSLLTWIAFNVFIIKMAQGESESNAKYLHLIVQALFGIYISSIMLVGEKLVIQIIASVFHQKSYEDRIDEQKRAIRFLTTLYRHSHDIGRADTLDRAFLGHHKGSEHPAKLLKTALKGVKSVAQSTTTVFGAVASEIAGERILQPNSPTSMVLSALSSANKSRQLARRIYYSFVPVNYRDVMLLGDITPCFDGNDQKAHEGFAILDKDENGDCSMEELETACLELHRERVALAASMRDLDSAVGRLDSILMFIWYLISLLIIIALMDVSFQTMLASAGTLLLGMSWLIGTTAQEVLASIIFLFIKHPYDVSDRVDVDSISYTVKEMHLLYTVFKQTDGKIVQLPNSVLNTKRVVNIRRSGPISEAFTWDVDFNTSFEKIEQLKKRMISFVQAERRDFLPEFDVSIQDFEGMEKLTLKADIKFKSNWQNGALKAQRRNKWICALKQVMAEIEVFGPAGAGNPNPKPDPTLIQLIDGPPLDMVSKQVKVPEPSRSNETMVDEKEQIRGNREGDEIYPGLHNIPLSPLVGDGVFTGYSPPANQPRSQHPSSYHGPGNESYRKPQ